MDPLAFAKLVRIAGYLESEADGEALNAARMATKMLRAAGLRWADVLHAPGARAQPKPRVKPAPKQPPKPDVIENWQVAELIIRDHWPRLNLREREFLTDIARKRMTALSMKQEAWLRGIGERLAIYSAA